MQFFLDTANLDEIRKAAERGILNGVTTNPTLIAREGEDHEKRIRQILEIFDTYGVYPGWISVETTTPVAEEMFKQGMQFLGWDGRHNRIVVKVPATPDGIRAASQFWRVQISVNVTLVFSVSQAILAAKTGALFVSPFVGRLDDISQDGIQLVRDIIAVYRAQKFQTKVLAASLRHPLHIVEAAKAGADIATMPFKVMEQLFHHPLTDAGLERFLSDWEKLQAELGKKEPSA